MAQPWSLAHRSYDAGRPPGLQSACSGTYRLLDEARPGPLLAECDGCGEWLGVDRAIVEAPVEREHSPVDEWLR